MSDSPQTLSPRAYRLALAAIILLGFGAMVIGFRRDILLGRFYDPDDVMRLQQVRDWIAGQSWFDVTQYRVNPPHGLPMHWSRLLDVPIAAAILLFRPLVGQPTAEIIACVTTPFLTYAALALLMADIMRRLLGNDWLALFAAGLCAADLGVYGVAHPMRIDHHGWQAACALAMVAALIGERTIRRAMIAGAVAALWLHISLEGIVFTAACGAWLGLRWIQQPEREKAALPAFLGAAATVSLLLFIVAHGGALFDRTFCDAVSPVHMIVLALAASGSALAVRLAPANPVARLGVLGATALLCVAAYKLSAPQCSGGPFAILTPLDYRIWYLNVAEGRPLWHQTLQMAVAWIAFPLVGLAGIALALRAPDRRPILVDYAALFGAAVLIGLFVLRAGAVSNILAIPGGVILLAHVSRRIRRMRMMLPRALAQTAAVLLLLPLTPSVMAFSLLPAAEGDAPPSKGDADCADLHNAAHLDALPPGLFMTQLDAAPTMISATRHSVVGAGYHRGAAAMDDVLRFFATDEAQARAVVRRRHPTYLFFCPDVDAAKSIARLAPQGLAARLVAGHSPAWLRPVHVPGLRHGQVYSVID